MWKNTLKRHVDLLLIREEGKRQYVLMKDLNTFMYDPALYHGRRILKSHVNDCFKINGKQMIKMPRKDEYVRFKNYERKIKSPFMI